MNSININGLSSLTISSFATKPFFDSVQKRTLVIATLIFTGMALIGIVIWQLKSKKVSQEKGKSKTIDVDNIVNTQKTKTEEKTKTSEKKSGKEAKTDENLKEKEIPQDPDVASAQKALSTLGFGHEELKEAIAIFAKQKGKEPVRKALEDYFKRALLQPQDKINIKEFYQHIQGDPEIVDMVFNQAVECWDSNKWNSYDIEMKLLATHFCTILEDLHGKAIAGTSQDKESYLAFWEKIVQIYSIPKPSAFQDTRYNKLREIIDDLSEKQIEELSALIAKTEDPFRFFSMLLTVVRDEQAVKVLSVCIPSSENGEHLETYYKGYYNAKTRVPTVTFFDIKHMGILFQHWLAKYNEGGYKKITDFLNIIILDHNEWSKIQMIEEMLNANLQIDLEKLLSINKKVEFAYRQPILPYLAGFYAMRHLDGTGSHEEHVAHLRSAVDFTDLMKGEKEKDERTILANFLAKRCSPDQLKTVLECLKDLPLESAQRMVQEFLETVLASKDADRIRHTFTIYWDCYENFHDSKAQSPSQLVEWNLINKIDDEEVLRLVYQAIPPTLVEEKKQAIKTLLIDGASHTSSFGTTTTYSVKLPPDVIKEIVK